MQIIEGIILLVTLGVFTAISLGLFHVAFYILKKTPNHEHNLKASGLFVAALFLFSFHSTVLMTIIAAIVGLFAIKYFYVHEWKETLHVWFVWLALWFVLVLLVVGITVLLFPASSAI